MGSAFRTTGGKRPVMRLALILLTILLALFFALEAIVLMGAKEEIKGTPDVILVLGCKIWGEEPSPALRSRLDRTLDYLAELEGEGEYPLIIVSGGKGDDEPLTEAQVMADYLIEQGISPERILVEDRATSTDTNIKYSLDLLEKQGVEWSHMAIASNEFHLARVRLLAGRYGVDCSTLSAPMPTLSSWLYSTLREGPALLKSFLLDG